MSEQLENQVETPVEQKYIYQPTDDSGRPIGGKQVIKYTTQDELIKELEKRNVLLIRKLRQETKNNRLGISEDEDLGADVQHLADPVEFLPRDLTQEELYEISRDLIDPTKAADAQSKLIEAKLGAPLESLGKTLQSIQQDNIGLRAKVEANAFVNSNPDYYKCDENMDAIVGWMIRYNLAPIATNFQKAYDTLKSQGVIIEGPPIIEQQPVIPAVPESPAKQEVVEEGVIQRVPGVSITRENTSDAATPTPLGSDITYTVGGRTLTGLAALKAMPSEEYKRRLLTDREFGKKVDKLDAEARKPRS